MDSYTPTICNYCESQAFENGQCIGCGASSWKSRTAIKRVFPKQQIPANDRGYPEADVESAGIASFVDLVRSTIRLIEKLISTATTIIKYKLIFIFSCLALVVFTGSYTSQPEEKRNNVSVSEFHLARSSEPSSVASIGTWRGKRFEPIPMQAPSPNNFIDIKNEPVPFSIPKTTWGAHFNPTNLVPDQGFLAFYFDSSKPTQLVNPVQVKNIGIKYNLNDFRGIHSRNFGAYWVGVITTQEHETIEVIADKGWNEFRVIIDGSIVQEHSRKSGPAKLVQITKVQQSTHRAPSEKVVILPESVEKDYPKSQAGNPLVTLTAGDHLIEVELLNNWHTTKFNAQFKRVRSD